MLSKGQPLVQGQMGLVYQPHLQRQNLNLRRGLNSIPPPPELLAHPDLQIGPYLEMGSLQVKLRRTLNPVTSVLIRRGEDTERERPGGDGHRLERCHHKPWNARCHQKQKEAERSLP